MSFMFNPTDYADPHAVNVLDPQGIDIGLAAFGSREAAGRLLDSGARTIGIDGYTTASFDVLRRELEAAAGRGLWEAP